MSAGPLRRATAIVGLLALAPIAGMVLTRTLTPEQAAVRALLVVGAVVLVGNLARVTLEQLLHRVEKDLVTTEDIEVPGAVGADASAAASSGAAPSFNRRAGDAGGAQEAR
ncbi:MAG: hypothetical protein ACLFUG_12045 [Nitriliruptoraceae bacterium]